MFTGLIEQCGILQATLPRGTGRVFQINTAPWRDGPLTLGESIAVNGACLTVSKITSQGFEAEVLAETLRCTTFATLQPGAHLNLERALRVGDRLGGHYVSGHIDTQGTLCNKQQSGDDWVFTFHCCTAFALQCVLKGSIAINGVSLTISALTSETVSVSLIPTTLRETNLGKLVLKDLVNLESDLLGKYCRRAQSAPAPITFEQLRTAGFTE